MYIHSYSASTGQVMGSTGKWERWGGGGGGCAAILLRMS